MSVHSQPISELASALCNALPPISDLSERTRDALSNLGASIVLDLYEAVQGKHLADATVVRQQSAPPPRKKEQQPNFLSDRWTVGDIEHLRANFSRHSLQQLSAELGRTTHAIVQKASKLKLTRDPIPKPWSEADIHYLQMHYATESQASIAARLGRTVSSISNKARKLGLYQYSPDLPQNGALWGDDEVEYLRGHQNDDIADVAAKLGRSIKAVYKKYCDVGIPRGHSNPAKNERDARIKQLRSKGLTRAQISERLGVSGAIVSKVTSNGSAQFSESTGTAA